MGSFVNNSLISGEEVVEEAKVSWLGQLGELIVAAIFIVLGFGVPILFVVGALAILMAIINIMTTELAVTNKKVIGKSGLIRRNALDMQLTKCESVIIDQGILGRILNYGTVVVRGTGGTPNKFPYIDKPLEFRKRVLEEMDKAQGQTKA